MKYLFGFPIWVFAASVWLRRLQTPVQRAEELRKDLRMYLESLEALKYHTPLPGNRFEAWLVKLILEWIDAEIAAARGVVMGKMAASATHVADVGDAGKETPLAAGVQE